MIYISSGGEKTKSAYETSLNFLKQGISFIELSGGLHDDLMFEKLSSLRGSALFQIHNYFPPPKFPNVLKQASLDKSVASATIEHLKMAIRWSAELGQSTYSFHAGFLMDPNVTEIGKKIRPRALFDRNKALSVFIERVNLIDDYAQNYGVKILIENNVLSQNNFKNFNSNPFLMVDANECLEVMDQTSKNVHLLVDVAHLKVSANSLGFDPVKFLASCFDWISAYHLSDNDGTRDSNEPVHTDSWFWPHLKRGLDYYSLEIYGVTPNELIFQRDLVKNKLGEKAVGST